MNGNNGFPFLRLSHYIFLFGLMSGYFIIHGQVGVGVASGSGTKTAETPKSGGSIGVGVGTSTTTRSKTETDKNTVSSGGGEQKSTDGDTTQPRVGVGGGTTAGTGAGTATGETPKSEVGVGTTTGGTTQTTAGTGAVTVSIAKTTVGVGMTFGPQNTPVVSVGVINGRLVLTDDQNKQVTVGIIYKKNMEPRLVFLGASPYYGKAVEALSRAKNVLAPIVSAGVVGQFGKYASIGSNVIADVKTAVENFLKMYNDPAIFCPSGSSCPVLTAEEKKPIVIDGMQLGNEVVSSIKWLLDAIIRRVSILDERLIYLTQKIKGPQDMAAIKEIADTLKQELVRFIGTGKTSGEIENMFKKYVDKNWTVLYEPFRRSLYSIAVAAYGRIFDALYEQAQFRATDQTMKNKVFVDQFDNLFPALIFIVDKNSRYLFEHCNGFDVLLHIEALRADQCT